MNAEAGIFCDLGKLGADGGVEERNATPDFATEWVE